MKRFLHFAVFFILFQVISFGQWQKISNNDLGLSGKLFTDKNALFLYGANNGFKVFRSVDDGINWTNITAQFPYDVYTMHHFQNEIIAVTKLSSGSAYLFYVSTDNGVSWSERSRIASVTGNGAIIGLASDGNSIYAISNRKSTYKSTDKGVTWSLEILNSSTSNLQTGFAAINDIYISTLQGTGCLISTNAGSSWATVNAGSIFVVNAYNVNGTLYGLTSGNGIFRLNTSTVTWEPINSGLPSPLTFQMSKFVLPAANIAVFGLHDFLTGTLTIYQSTNNGSEWLSIGNENLPIINAAINNHWVAYKPGKLFLYNYSSTASNTGLYTISLSTINDAGLPSPDKEFSLLQNFPNPFNPATTISFHLTISSNIKLQIYSASGEMIKVLADNYFEQGAHEVVFNAENLSSGVYYCRLVTGEGIKTQKLLLLK